MKSKHLRLISQIAFFAFIAIIAVNHSLTEIGRGLGFVPELSLHAICPFGGVATLASLIMGQGLIRQLHASVMVIGSAVLLLTLIFGPVFCSHICPLGSIQEWIGKLGKKIFKNRYNKLIPQKLHNILKYLRYVVLVLVLVQTYRTATLMFANVDPYYALFNFWTGEATIAAISILVVTLIMSLFVERPWCKYACPYGGLLGLVSKISLFKIRRNEATCVSCGLCDRKCPMLIDVSKKKKVTDTLCNRCMQCTYEEGGCPVDRACYNGILNAKQQEEAK
ncbi:MAG: 4Fe-4S binding protein [Clostridia bacterium]|nr:4Fe-4S binding protein [Clostridia bacterium]